MSPTTSGESIMVRKVVLLGPPEAGKTTLRKLLFEGASPRALLERSEPPSIGKRFHRYNYMLARPRGDDGMDPERVPVDLVIVDTAGQELDRWLTTSSEEIFTSSSLLFLIFDVQDWFVPERKQQVLDLVLLVNDTRMNFSSDAMLFIFAHKFDLVDAGGDMMELARRIKMELQDHAFETKQLMLDFNVSVSSITEAFRDASHRAFFDRITGVLDIA